MYLFGPFKISLTEYSKCVISSLIFFVATKVKKKVKKKKSSFKRNANLLLVSLLRSNYKMACAAS